MAEFFAQYIPTWAAYLVTALISAVLLLTVVGVGALFFIWAERKVSGRIQDRLGPTRTGGKFGWLQSLADGIKLLTKEDLAPGDADKILFRLAPYVSLAPSYAALLALPFADGWVGWEINSALFFLLAVLGLEVFGVILAGYASGSKWSLFGAMRQAAQVVSYEVPLGMCGVIPVILCGTMSLTAIGNMQAGFATNWIIFHDPFTFLVFWVYVTCAVASVNRAPFDLAEAESELVAGFHTEYSGLRWSFFFMAEYNSMFIVSALAVILFLGGWNGPVPIFATWKEAGGGWEIAANLFGCMNFIGKTVVGVIVMVWVRWTLPRLRIDQVITTCLKYCVPIAAFCFVGVLGWQLASLPSPHDWAPLHSAGKAAVREPWVDRALRLEAAEESVAVERVSSREGVQ